MPEKLKKSPSPFDVFDWQSGTVMLPHDNICQPQGVSIHLEKV